MKTLMLPILAAAVAAPVCAQDYNAAPLPVQQAPAANAVLPVGTEVVLRMTQEITTKGDSWNENDTFLMTVAQDVFHEGMIVIPRGSRAVGRISWLTSKGMFGKSGKMDLEIEYVEVKGRRIELDGTFRQEGEGNTVATVGGVVIAGVFGGFITGKSARVPRGRELIALTERPVELAMPGRRGPQYSQYAGSAPRASSNFIPAGGVPNGYNLPYEELLSMVEGAARSYVPGHSIGDKIIVNSFAAEGGTLRLDTNIHPESNPDKVADLICQDKSMQYVLVFGGTVAASFGGNDLRVSRETCGL